MLHVKQCICWEKVLLICIYLSIASWNLFDQTITSVLLYGSEIRGFENLNALEKMHQKRFKDEKQHAA